VLGKMPFTKKAREKNSCPRAGFKGRLFIGNGSIFQEERTEDKMAADL
jgi:hypothetical protein